MLLLRNLLPVTILGSLLLTACTDEPTAAQRRELRALNLQTVLSTATETYDDVLAQVDSEAPGFAGVFRDSAGSVTILLTAEGRSRELDVRRVARKRLNFARRGLADFEQALTVTYSFRELQSWRIQMAQAAPRGDIASTDVSERLNRVVIEAQSDMAQARLQRVAVAIGVPPEAIEIKIAEPRQPMLNILLDQIPGSPAELSSALTGGHIVHSVITSKWTAPGTT